MLDIILHDEDVEMEYGSFYNTRNAVQPLKIRELIHYGDLKIIRIKYKKFGYKRMCDNLQVINLLLPDATYITSCKAQLGNLDNHYIWYTYKKVKHLKKEEVRKIKIGNLLLDS